MLVHNDTRRVDSNPVSDTTVHILYDPVIPVLIAVAIHGDPTDLEHSSCHTTIVGRMKQFVPESVVVVAVVVDPIVSALDTRHTGLQMVQD